ncbi:hypothetical protein L1987_56653 [Smallanthus sonchifolius]|uniref:Uncharacterized protein n=1 Tax=Smallanthus sonchifolius TaxID=185202 RepID=A0ACB9EDS5_9ASTR|nr:hypothetical protein L1987_56653 [Smallanthus sonchifolius]
MVMTYPILGHGATKHRIRNPGKPNYGLMKQKPDFINALLKATLEQAAEAESNTRGLGVKCRNNLKKATWNDCLQLYDNNVKRINMTVDPKNKCSQDDTQTWLSTALTNLETCKIGFEELGVSDYMLPLTHNNVSSLISNALAMNKGGNSPNINNPNSYKKGFPTWVKLDDRNLLQSSNPSSWANAVMAQEGSGNYKTIGAALAAAKSGTGRYVIYVKAGIYSEYIQVKSDNIMIVGDGIGKTIITGSKSVGGGSTTYESSTMGTVDFIFGNAAVVLQSCNILARDPPNKTNTLTAQGRTDPNQNTVNPVGWMPWSGNFALDTLYYGEYMNTGPGLSTANRIKWKGYHVITSAAEATKFTPGSFIAGGSWFPGIGVP